MARCPVLGHGLAAAALSLLRGRRRRASLQKLNQLILLFHAVPIYLADAQQGLELRSGQCGGTVINQLLLQGLVSLGAVGAQAVVVLSVVCVELEAAGRAGVVLLQPRLDAAAVEGVLAGQTHDSVARLTGALLGAHSRLLLLFSSRLLLLLSSRILLHVSGALEPNHIIAVGNICDVGDILRKGIGVLRGLGRILAQGSDVGTSHRHAIGLERHKEGLSKSMTSSLAALTSSPLGLHQVLGHSLLNVLAVERAGGRASACGGNEWDEGGGRREAKEKWI